jgi:hypothetical protein
VAAVRRHQLPDFELLLRPGSDLDHDACVRVAHGDRLGQLAPHRLDRLDDAFGPGLVDDLAHPLRLLHRLLHQVGPAEVDQHPLGTRGHE